MNSTRRIGLLLTLVFLLPALFFSVYELSSLDKDEKMIEDIYSKQLDAILFSVNQYSDDILGNWAARVETGFHDIHGEGVPQKIKNLLELNPSLVGVFINDSVNGEDSIRVFSVQEVDDDLVQRTRSALKQDSATVHQLFKYKKSGFQKITKLNIALEGPNQTLQCLIYVTQNAWGQFRLAGFYIDPELFIQDIVGPRLQAVAQDQFVLSALVKGTDSAIYTTWSAAGPEVANQAEALTKDFWIFSDYVLGIRTKGETLQQLIDERTRINFLLLAALDLILIIAVILVFKNLKKEVDLAQNKADFVSNVSHEIRTPLALISMFAETLEMNRVPTEEKKQEYYRIISKETQRLTGIVNKILNFSQAEAKKKIIHLERIDINSELKDILTTYEFHLRNKGFEYTLATSGAIWVKADKEALMEAVVNLIDNAVKYSEDKKHIAISTGLENGFGFISFKDQGVGISKADQKHIFDKFYRVHKGNLARSRGTGLGLSLVKQLMEEQHGRITVDSEPGKGSTFTIFFPLD
jgi:two-component system, OmpR family, phosphate regulon sensor histidine kinase PhoR